MDELSDDQRIFEIDDEGSRKSARAAVPMVCELVKPQSVVDVGCGVGAWLAEFQAAGMTDFVGLDGDYIAPSALVIDPEHFVVHELGEPVDLGRRFDLAVSLEVGEHLPEEEAGAFVASLTALAPVVLFSAAIPHQGGDGHVNEQWPEYWQARFAERNYVVVDCLRERLWRHKDVEPWCAQNLLLFVERTRLSHYPALATYFERAGEQPRLSLVHPEHYQRMYEQAQRDIADARRVALQASVNLRKINLIAFPDWALPQAQLVEQLRGLFGAVLMHPQGLEIALIIQYSGEGASGLLAHVAKEFLSPGGVQIAAGPAISGIGPTFRAEQWKILVPLLTGRIVLANEDQRALAATDAGRLPTLPLSAIQAKKRLEI